MPAQKLKKFLDKNKIKYVAISHSPTYTAQEIAASAHVPGQEMAKTVIIKVNGKMAMAVLPAPHKVDFKILKEALGAKSVELVELATEQEFADSFPECEPGAMPPFGNLYDMDVFVAKKLTEDEEIAFNAGTHTELVKLSYKDFEKLVKPKVLTFAHA
ncbi:MAG: aminoacyl-tRNA deacylase [Planctomycetota bacterium]|jgi:Ala-tRNA(Pro) deacylase